jgi:acyl-coenzyme A synthetase/AMP-(fatty) acid ligase
MTPSLTQLPVAAPTFRLRSHERAWTLPDIVREATRIALPDAPAIEIPAADPVVALTHLEAAFMRGLVPVPNARLRAPRGLALEPDLPGAALALRTSGSTGAPRLPAFAFDAVVRSSRRIAAYLGLGPEDELALLQPLDHGFGLIGQLFAAIASGAAVTSCASPFPDERADAVATSQAGVLAAVPHTLRELSEHLPELDALATRRLRSIGSAGGRLAPALARRLAIAFPEAVIWNQYGCTEAGPRLTAVPSTHPAFYTGTVGRALPGVHLWIADPLTGEVLAAGRPGEICFRSDMQMLGYLGDPVATARQRRSLGPAAGFFTGDLGVLDPEDRLHLLGRADDLVKVRGERISLEAIAHVAESVGARAAIAIFVEPEGEAADGQVTLVYEADRELSTAQLAKALPPSAGPMLPRRLLWVPHLPRLASGKVDRAAVETLAFLAGGSAT